LGGETTPPPEWGGYSPGGWQPSTTGGKCIGQENSLWRSLVIWEGATGVALLEIPLFRGVRGLGPKGWLPACCWVGAPSPSLPPPRGPQEEEEKPHTTSRKVRPPPRIPARKSSAMRQRSVPIGLDGRSILLVCGVGLCWVGLCCWLDPELPSKTLRSCLDQSDRGWPSFIRIKQKNLTSKSFIKFWHWNQKKFKMQKRK